MSHYYDYDYLGYGLLAGIGTVGYIIFLAISVLTVIAMWKIYVKAGEEGWAAIIPFYSQYILYKITWGNGWLFLLLLIPLVNVVISIITMVKLATAFGKGGGWACGLIFLNTIFILIMGFSEDIQYVGVPGREQEYNPGGYGGGGYQGDSRYQDPYQRDYRQKQEPEFRQYTQGSASNEQYRYTRNESPGSQGSQGGYCPACGAKVEPGTKFCAICGKQL